WIIKVVTALGALMAALSGAAVAVAAVMGPLLAFGALGAVLTSLVAGFVLILKLLIVTLVLFGAPIMAIVSALGYLAAKFVGAKGLLDMFAKWGILIKATVEGLHNLDGAFTRISTETAAELERNGVMDQFLDIMNTILKLKNGFVAFKDEIVKGIPAMIEAIRPMLLQVMDLGDVMRGVFGSSARDDMHSMEGAARGFAQVILWVTIRVLNLMDTFVTLAAVVAKWMLSLGQISNAQYLKVVGAPDAMGRLPKEIQDKILAGDETVWATNPN